MSINKEFLNQETNITAKIIKDSTNSDGDRITTFELEYPRFIHAEFMTHHMLSKNSSSSRAIPISKMVSLIKNNPAMPVYWGKKQSGMQAKHEVSDFNKKLSKFLWKSQMYLACTTAKALDKLKLHKQISNRILEPFQMIKIVCTATNFDNFYNLRIHKDAQPEIILLAYKMYEAQGESVPTLLREGDWHLPYVNEEYNNYTDSSMYSYNSSESEVLLTLEDAIKYSVACCAAVSYRTEAMTLNKARKIYDMLIQADVKHSSPLEHQALCIGNHATLLDIGITHHNKKGKCCSGNLVGWIQNRHLLADNTCNNYEHKKRIDTFN